MASNSRLLKESVITVRAPQNVPQLQFMTRDLIQRALVLLVLIGLILFLRLAEVSQVSTTEFDIEKLDREYHQLQETNRELEREIAELESPANVMEFAHEHGFEPAYDADYVIIEQDQTGEQDTP